MSPKIILTTATILGLVGNTNVGITLTMCRIYISQWYVLCGVVDGLLIF
jgi:hypothetical protein